MSSPLPIPLSYAPALSSNPRRTLLFLLLSSPTLILPFLDFAYSISPLQAVVESELYAFPFGVDWEIGLLACPFFAAPLLVAYHTLLHVHPAPSHRLRRLLATLAFLAWLPLCLLLGTMHFKAARGVLEDPSSFYFADFWPFPLTTLLAIAGLFLTRRFARRGAPLTALSFAYATPFLANAVLCLIALHDTSPGPGYYLTAALLPILLADLTLRYLAAPSSTFTNFPNPH